MAGSKQTPKAGATVAKPVPRPDPRTGRNRYPTGPPDPLPGHSPLRSPPLVNDAQLMHDLCLDWTEDQVAEFRASLPVYHFKTLDAANVYPPDKVWAVEKLPTVHNVEEYIRAREAGRKNPKPVHELDMSRFKKIIGPDEDAVLYDENGNIFGVVIRNFLPVPELVNTFDLLAAKHIGMSRDIRKLDCGKIVQFGYTTGDDKAPTFGWCRNLLSIKHSDEDKRLHNHALMSAHTLLWNICRKKLPKEILDAYEKVMDGGPVADWNMMGEAVDAPISLRVGGQDHEIYGLALGPPQGLCSTMYARSCHLENDCPIAPYVGAWTCSRTVNPDLGGSFYFAKHGVIITQATNTFFIHNARQHHGTTVHDIDWQNWRASTNEGDVTHRGFGWCFPGRLAESYRRFQEAKAKAQSGTGAREVGVDWGAGERREDDEESEMEEDETAEETQEQYRREELAILAGELRVMSEQIATLKSRH